MPSAAMRIVSIFTRKRAGAEGSEAVPVNSPESLL